MKRADDDGSAAFATAVDHSVLERDRENEAGTWGPKPETPSCNWGVNSMI